MGSWVVFLSLLLSVVYTNWGLKENAEGVNPTLPGRVLDVLTYVLESKFRRLRAIFIDFRR
jgi:hypothetical protein|tara:strand:+ start:21105 stop:21287 length:183 start_codon:yes stop_codon:yes gene_type:complete